MTRNTELFSDILLRIASGEPTDFAHIRFCEFGIPLSLTARGCAVDTFVGFIPRVRFP